MGGGPERSRRGRGELRPGPCLAPDDVRALNGAATAAEAANDDEKALALLLRARKASPDDIRILLHFGSVCLKRDLTVDALDAIGKAYKLAPANNLALFLYARAQISIQQWQLAHDLLTEFDRRVPNYAPAQYALGGLDLRLNRNEEARGHLRAASCSIPRFTTLVTNWARSIWRTGEWKKRKLIFEPCSTRSPAMRRRTYRSEICCCGKAI